MNLEGKHALITGGSSGIGLALARKLAASGADVTILGRDPNKLEAARQEISTARRDPNLLNKSLAADVSDAATLQGILKGYIQHYGAPDLLVNSAGVTYAGNFADLDLDIFKSMMDINYFGTLNTIKAVLPGMIERRSGYIVNISSLAGVLGVYGYSAYGPSKFAIRGLSDILLYELAEYGIKVSVVFPPDTQTPQLEFEKPLKPPILTELDKSNKVLSADTVAQSIIKGILKNKYIITPGFDSSLYFQLTNFFGLVYPVMGFMVNQARNTVSRAKNNGSH